MTQRQEQGRREREAGVTIWLSPMHPCHFCTAEVSRCTGTRGSGHAWGMARTSPLARVVVVAGQQLWEPPLSACCPASGLSPCSCSGDQGLQMPRVCNSFCNTAADGDSSSHLCALNPAHQVNQFLSNWVARSRNCLHGKYKQNHWTTEWLGWQGPLEVIWPILPAQAGLPGDTCSGPCPGGF